MTSVVVPRFDGPVDLVVGVPGSKSISARALVCAALATGVSDLIGIAPGDDTATMIGALGALGVAIEAVEGDRVRVTGSGGVLARRPATIDAGLAGTTSRFITAVAALGSASIRIEGEPALSRRPMAALHRALIALGAEVEWLGEAGHLPVVVRGPLGPGVVDVPGDISSQFLTALVLVAPVIGGLRIEIGSELVSRPYVEMTAAVMAEFGATAPVIGEDRIDIGAGGYHGREYRIEVDASSASYPLGIGAVVGGRVEVPGLGRGSLQGDRRFADLLAEMGCRTTWTDTSVTVERPPERRLWAIDVDMADISDLVPTVAAVAVHATGTTRIRGVGFIRAKESDRISDLADQLRRFGARVLEHDDGLEIEGIDPVSNSVGSIDIDTHDDHRLAMAAAVAGSIVPGPVTIDVAEVVSKSWPSFWEDCERWRR